MDETFFRMIDVIFLIEHKSREFSFAELLSNNLKTKGISCKILSLEFEAYKLLNLKAKVICIPWAIFDDEWPIAFLTNFKGKIISLNWEQYLIPLAREYRRPKGKFVKEIFHYSWSNSFTDFLLESGIPKNKIIQDKNPSIFTFQKRVKLNLENGIIFCPLNYAWSFKTDKDVIKIASNKKFNLESCFEIRNYAINERDNFLKEISKVLDKGHKVLLRPHPSITEDKYKNLEAFDSRLVFAKEGSISDYLNNVMICISSWSTTLLVFNEIGIPSLSFRKNFYPKSLVGEWNNEYNFVNNSEDILRNIKSIQLKKPQNKILEIEDFNIAKTISLLTIRSTDFYKVVNFSNLKVNLKILRTFLRNFNIIIVKKSLIEDRF